MTNASRAERWLLVLTPAVAMTAVAIGLRVGARGGLRAAVVFGARASAGGAGLAWQVVVFDEDHGVREPVSGLPVDVLARAGRAGEVSAHGAGVTNADGVAEVLLALPSGERAGLVGLEVRSGSTTLARGAAEPPPSPEVPGVAATPTGWLRFARREGAIALDVALLGQRTAPGFPAELWVRATDAASHEPVPHAAVALESDTSLLLAATAAGTTDSRGWARVVATPVGLAVTATLRARSPDGRVGEWTGGLFMSPGAPNIVAADRVQPNTPFALAVTMPTARTTAYVEIDDARGRAWAAAPALAARADGTSRVDVEAPGLAPGLYWAIASADPASGASLGAGTIARPFLVASSDDAAFAFGADPDACARPRDVREVSSALGSCLALSGITPVPRWTALDGFVGQRDLDRAARAKGLVVALGALLAAIALEGLLLLRAASGARSGAGCGPGSSASARRIGTVGLAVLVGLLGFALLAAFIVRV